MAQSLFVSMDAASKAHAGYRQPEPNLAVSPLQRSTTDIMGGPRRERSPDSSNTLLWKKRKYLLHSYWSMHRAPINGLHVRRRGMVPSRSFC